MRTIKYKHICPNHGIETCHCINGAQGPDLGVKSPHQCTVKPIDLDMGQRPLRFMSKRFTARELYTEPRESRS